MVGINGCRQNNIGATLPFAVQLEHGTDEEGDAFIKFGWLLKLQLVLIWKGDPQGKITKEVTALNHKMQCMVQMVTKKGTTNEAAVAFIVKETLRDGQCAVVPHIACGNMGANLKSHGSNNSFCVCMPLGTWAELRCTHTIHSLTCVLVVICVACKLCPCLSYSTRRDRINLGPNLIRCQM